MTSVEGEDDKQEAVPEACTYRGDSGRRPGFVTGGFNYTVGLETVPELGWAEAGRAGVGGRPRAAPCAQLGAPSCRRGGGAARLCEDGGGSGRRSSAGFGAAGLRGAGCLVAGLTAVAVREALGERLRWSVASGALLTAGGSRFSSCLLVE